MDSSQTKGEDFFLLKDVKGNLDLSLKQRVRMFLLRVGEGQNWLADKCSISHGAMSQIINGHWGASSQIKLAMAKHLEVDTLILFGPKQYFEEYLKKMDYKLEGEND